MPCRGLEATISGQITCKALLAADCCQVEQNASLLICKAAGGRSLVGLKGIIPCELDRDALRRPADGKALLQH